MTITRIKNTWGGGLATIDQRYLKVKYLVLRLFYYQKVSIKSFNSRMDKSDKVKKFVLLKENNSRTFLRYLILSWLSIWYFINSSINVKAGWENLGIAIVSDKT